MPGSARCGAPRRCRSARGGARRRRGARRPRRRGSASQAFAERFGVFSDRFDIEHLGHLHLLRLLGRGRAGRVRGLRLRSGLTGRRRARGGPVHDALPVEDAALFDDERLRRDVAVDRPPRARCAFPFTAMLPLKRPATETFCARMSASTWLCGESVTSPSALICPFTCPSIRRRPAETTLPSSVHRHRRP